MKNVFLILLVAVLLVGTMGGTAMAMTVAMEKPPEEDSVDQVETVSVRGTAKLIILAGAGIKNQGNLRVTVGGFTQAANPIEYISGRVYLQRFDGTKWVNVASHLFYRFNHFWACGDRTFTVTPGYYRARSIHYAEHNDQSHSLYATTGYMYIN